MDVFLLFAGEGYYAGGGWKDFKGTYLTLDEAMAELDYTRVIDYYGWWHIVQFNALQGLGKIVEQGAFV